MSPKPRIFKALILNLFGRHSNVTPPGFSHPVFLGKYTQLQASCFPKYVALRKIFEVLLEYSYVQKRGVRKNNESDL